MKKTSHLFSALILLFSYQKMEAQCVASITNVPHGDCANTDIELIASGNGTANGFSYQWSGPQGFTSSDQFVNIYYAQSGASGFYKVIITNPAGCTSTDSVNIVKHPLPSVHTGGQSGGCTGTSTSIYAQDFSGSYGPYTYLWETGATTQSISVGHNGGVYPAPACYMTNVYGCTAPNNSTFLIYSFPNPSSPVIEAAAATSFCSGGNVTLTTTNDPNLTYQWSKISGTIAGATTSNYIATIGGSYFLNVTTNMGCTAVSNSIKVTVFTKPSVTISISGSLNVCNGDSVNLIANTGSGLTYQWKKYTNIISTATSSALMVKKSGTYKVIVTNANGCSKQSASVIVTSNCRTEEAAMNENENSISVYPNPSSTNFNLDLSNVNLNQTARLIIYDLTGRVISATAIEKGTTNYHFGESLPAGIYTATLSTENKIQNIRIIKTE